MIAVLGELSKNNVIEYIPRKIKLTESGKKWILSNRHDIFLTKKQIDIKEIPEEFLSHQLDINELYKPKHEKLDKDILQNIKRYKNRNKSK